MDYRSLPKIELHLHLDCSLSYEVVQQINPFISFEEFRANFVAPSKCTDLADYISRAVNGISLMQTTQNLELVTADLFRQLHEDHVIYAEIRFAPLQHLELGLSASEVVEAVNNACTKAIATTGINASIILCTLRHYNNEQSMQTVKLVKAFAGTHVTGFDIAANEAGFPIDEHITAFEFANANGISCTAHAGEARGASSVWETLKHFHPKRIGHGVRSAEDEVLMDHLKANKIHLEVCPTSNIQVNVFDTISQHPADRIYNHGISMSINTDARTISDVTLADEYKTMEENFNWNLNHFKRCNLEAIEHAFTTREIKEALKNKILQAY
jgi:adenosine deaminase